MEYKYGKNVSKEFIKEKLNWNTKYWIKTGQKYAKLSTVEQKKCYVCSGNKGKPVSSFYGINYIMCQNCNHVYTDKRLSEEGLKKYYSESQEYFNDSYTKKSIINLRKNLFIPKIEFIKKYVKGKNWLDVGSADGTAVVAAKSEGFQCTGIELSKTAREFAKKHHNIKLNDKPLEDFVRENKTKWNIVSFFGVLEHISNPTNAVKISNKLLEKNGIIALEVPNYNSLSTHVQNISNMPDRHLVPFSHIMIFTLKSAKQILKNHGFEPIAVWFWGMDVIELFKHVIRKARGPSKLVLGDLPPEILNALQLVFDGAKMSDEFLIIGKKIKNL